MSSVHGQLKRINVLGPWAEENSNGKKLHVKYQTSFTRYKRCQNYYIALSPKKHLCFYCRILLVALHIALICSTTLSFDQMQ